MTLRMLTNELPAHLKIHLQKDMTSLLVKNKRIYTDSDIFLLCVSSKGSNYLELSLIAFICFFAKIEKKVGQVILGNIGSFLDRLVCAKLPLYKS